MKKIGHFFFLIIFLFNTPSASAVERLSIMSDMLKRAKPDQLESVFVQCREIVSRATYKEAIIWEDNLLHLSARLDHAPEAFGWMYELTKETYNDSGHRENLFLYLLSISDDPAFQDRDIHKKILYEIGSSYYDMGDYAKAQVNLEKFVMDYHNAVNRDLINGLTMLGLIYQERRNFSGAERYFRTAFDMALANKDSVWIDLAKGNLGSLYLQMGRISPGLPLIYDDLSASLRRSLYESAANDYFDLSTAALTQGKLKWAKSCLDSALVLLYMDKRPYRRSWARVYRNLAFYHHAIGKGDSAYYYLLLSQQILDSIERDQKGMMLKQRVNAFSLKKADQDALLVKASMESSRQSRLLAAVSFLAVVIVSGLALSYIRQKKRNNRMLREKAMLIEAERRQEEERRKKEEAANQAKSKLFSLVAHDLRGPIGGLAGLMDMVDKGQMAPDKFQSMLPMIKTRIDNLYKVTDNLLRWAYTQMEGNHIKKELFQLQPVVNSIAMLLKEDAGRKGIELRASIPTDFELMADPNQIEIVLRNLISNSIKFSPKGSTLFIEAVAAEDEIVIYVRDNGPGLPDTVVRNLALGEFSEPATGTGGEKGAGLGLVICKEFVEMNGAKLEVMENKPQGTVFKILFNCSKPG